MIQHDTKGYDQMSGAQMLLGEGDSGLRKFSLQILADAKEAIRLHADVPGMSEQAQEKVSQALRRITGAIDKAVWWIKNSCLDIENLTMDNLEITDNLDVDGDRVTAYINTSMNLSGRLNLTKAEVANSYVQLCANYYPEDESLSIYYFLRNPDGTEGYPVTVPNLTDGEREAIWQLMENFGLEECVAEIAQVAQQMDQMM